MDNKHKKIISDTSWSYSGSASSMRKLANTRMRQHGKAVAVSELADFEELQDSDFVRNIRWNLEERYATDCHFEESFGPAARLGSLLMLLGIGNFRLHKCTCPKLDGLTDKEILALDGL